VQRDESAAVTSDDQIPSPEIPKGWEMFQTNAAKTGVIFPEKHSYYQDIKQKEAREIKAKAIALIPPKE